MLQHLNLPPWGNTIRWKQVVDAMEITPGIHRVDGVTGANCYIVDTGHEIVVIDSGMPGNANRIVKYIRGLGRNETDVCYAVFTHADVDHVGSAAELKKLTGAKVAIHAGDAPIISGEKEFKSMAGPLGLLLKLIARLMHFQPVKPDFILEDGVEIGGLMVLHTPGHTTGSVCLYSPRSVIFVGDALRSDSAGMPRSPSRFFSADAAQCNASLVAISKMEFDILLPGHGAAVRDGASAKVRGLVSNLKSNVHAPQQKQNGGS